MQYYCVSTLREVTCRFPLSIQRFEIDPREAHKRNSPAQVAQARHRFCAFHLFSDRGASQDRRFRRDECVRNDGCCSHEQL